MSVCNVVYIVNDIKIKINFRNCFIVSLLQTIQTKKKSRKPFLSNNYIRKYRVRQITFFFGKCFKNKRLNILSNFFFYLKVQSFRLIMENNFIQMAASAGHAVASTIGPILKHIIICEQLHFTNSFTNIVL